MYYAKKNYKYNNVEIKYYIEDARSTVKSSNKIYDVIFLDAFSPKKDPVLWTINFLSELKKHMTYDSILISYSKSTPFRSALTQLDLITGKIISNGEDIGTISSVNPDNILNKLSDYDFELINTRSGITYKDPNFNLSPSDILNNRFNEQNSSSRISRTEFIKKLHR